MSASIEHPKSNRLMVWLFNPFTYIAGWQALCIGLTVITLTALLGSVGNVHFDGVLDTHVGAITPVWFFFAEGFMNWLCMATPILLAGLTLRGFSFRIIDVFGTQALSRWPMLFAAAVGILPANRRVTEELIKMVQTSTRFPALPPLDMIIFAASTIIIVVMSVWMVALMYRAFTVSCNLKGAKAIVSFIVCLIIAEIISKIGFYVLLTTTPTKPY